MLPIIKNLTSVNRTLSSSKPIRYIVIKTTNQVASAETVTNANKKVYTGASEHYVVDDYSIMQEVEDKDIAWACGCNHPYHPHCKNGNSITIAMSLRTSSTVSNATIKNTGELVRYLMDKYDIPANNVIRLYDISRKLNPAPYVEANKWKELKAELLNISLEEVEAKFDPTINPFPAPERALFKGNAGDDVRWVQFEVNNYDIDGVDFNLELDGVFGNGLKGAIGVIQEKHGLEVTYKVDLPTLKLLKELSTKY